MRINRKNDDERCKRIFVRQLHLTRARSAQSKNGKVNNYIHSFDKEDYPEHLQIVFLL